MDDFANWLSDFIDERTIKEKIFNIDSIDKIEISRGKCLIESDYIEQINFEDMDFLNEITTLDIKCKNLFYINQFPKNIIQLTIKSSVIEKLPDLPETLKILILGCENLSEIPILPFGIINLEIFDGHINKLPILPKTLEKISIVNTEIKEFIYISDNLNYLYLDRNPLVKIILKTKPENLFIDKEDIIEYTNKLYKLNEKKYTVKSIKELNRSLVKKFIFKGQEIDYITLPKGTVLFRTYTKASYLQNDFKGLSREDGFIMYTNYALYFYPYPFIAGDIYFSVGGNIPTCIFVLNRDTDIILGINPSKLNRDDKDKEIENNYLYNCGDSVNLKDSIETGRSYDPCLNPDLVKENKNIKGEIFISDTDSGKINRYFKDLKKNYKTSFRDSKNNIGVPEIILHPYVERDKNVFFKPSASGKIDPFKNGTFLNSDIYKIGKDSIKELANWTNLNEDNLNIKLLYSNFIENDEDLTNIEENIELNLMKKMDDLLSPSGSYLEYFFEGKKKLHFTIDKNTHFYIIAEIADKEYYRKNCIPIEMPDKLSYFNDSNVEDYINEDEKYCLNLHNSTKYDIIKWIKDPDNIVFGILKGDFFESYCVNRTEIYNKIKKQKPIFIKGSPYFTVFLYENGPVIIQQQKLKDLFYLGYNLFKFEFKNNNIYEIFSYTYLDYIEEVLAGEKIGLLKNKFILELSKIFKTTNIERSSKLIKGVSFLPVDISDKSINVILGKETDGIYQDLFNMIGGKIEAFKNPPNIYDIFSCLFDEVYEELGIVLNSKDFMKSLIYYELLPYETNFSLIFVCYLDNFNPKKWYNMMKERFEKYGKDLPLKYQEMSEMKKISINDTSMKFSRYFKNFKEKINYDKILNYYDNTLDFVSFRNFEPFEKYGI